MNRRWMPAALLGVGALFTVGVDTQRTMPLRGSLEAALPATLEGFPGTDGVLSEQERAVAGMSAYVVRTYAPPAISTPNIPTTSSSERSTHSPTRVSRSTPAARSRPATRRARRSSSS